MLQTIKEEIKKQKEFLDEKDFDFIDMNDDKILIESSLQKMGSVEDVEKIDKIEKVLEEVDE